LKTVTPATYVAQSRKVKAFTIDFAKLMNGGLKAYVRDFRKQTDLLNWMGNEIKDRKGSLKIDGLIAEDTTAAEYWILIEMIGGRMVSENKTTDNKNYTLIADRLARLYQELQSSPLSVADKSELLMMRLLEIDSNTQYVKSKKEFTLNTNTGEKARGSYKDN
jgi:hypothetical protein